MTPSISRGTIAQLLSFATFAAGFTGHSEVAAILRDPNLATELTTFLGLGFTLWGIAEHIYAAWTVKRVLAPPRASERFVNSLFTKPEVKK